MSEKLPLLMIVSLALVACDSEEEPEFRAGNKPTQARCTMTRIAGGSKKSVSATFKLSGDGLPVSSERLTAFTGDYGFSVFAEGDGFDVIITEDAVINDEFKGFGCGKAPKKKGATFCAQQIEIDKNLGIEEAKEEPVKAFNFSCKTLSS